MTRRFVTLLVLILAFGPPPEGTFAQQAKEQKLTGTVTMAAADHVMFKTPDGKDGIVMVMDDTKVTRDKKAMKAQDIKVGTRISIIATQPGNVAIAKEIQVGADPKAPVK